MSLSQHRPVAIFYEHPEWFAPLFVEMERRGLCMHKIDARRQCYDIGAPPPECSVFLNRMSPSAHLRGLGSAVLFTLDYLGYLESQGIAVINGTEAYRTEISKARQLALLARLGLPYPASRVLHRSQDAPLAADGLRFPVLVKPNVGGSGAGIRRFDSLTDLRAAADGGELDLGLDGSGLVQEFIPTRDGFIVRAEVVGGRFLYAIRIYPQGDDFNLCPADLCQQGRREEGNSHRELRIERHQPEPEVIAEVERLLRATGIEVGGVEYTVDDRDGSRRYYDINALSNFVADAPTILGFDPFVDLVDFIETRVAEVERAGLMRRAG